MTDPQRPGLHPHRHEPDHLYGWVFLQHQVWVDYWGHEHEIELMAGDYVANVIGFCERRALRIALIVWSEIAYRLALHQCGLGDLSGGTTSTACSAAATSAGGRRTPVRPAPHAPARCVLEALRACRPSVE
jgi:hypothetical protein